MLARSVNSIVRIVNGSISLIVYIISGVNEGLRPHRLLRTSGSSVL